MSGKPIQVPDVAAGPERRVFTLPGGEEMAFRHIVPTGPFRMGSRGYFKWEEPCNWVTLAGPFWIAETPVTQAQFAAWTRENAIEHENHFRGNPNNPAEKLDWRQANAFCEWMRYSIPAASSGTVMPDGFDLFCLPTEAEWEYACRAGTETEYYTGDGEAALHEAGWFGEGWDQGSTHPVRQKKPNAYGLYDLHGNVWEWCHDELYDDEYRCRSNESVDLWAELRQMEWAASSVGNIRHNRQFLGVFRGGSWLLDARHCRSSCRNGRMPHERSESVGFRVCLVRGSSTNSTHRVETHKRMEQTRGIGPMADDEGQMVGRTSSVAVGISKGGTGIRGE